MFNEYADLLTDLTHTMVGIKLSEEQINQFCAYGDLLLEWNQKMNLTRIIEPKEIIIKHFIDSLTAVRYISERKMADIGTGAGFPGLPIKIVKPEIELFLVDSLAKRLDFLNHVITELDLQNTVTVHARAEEFGHKKEYREQFDIVISRAVARLPVLIEYAIPLLKINGIFLASKGAKVYEEIEDSDKVLSLLKAELRETQSFRLGSEAEKHAIVVIKKLGQTSGIYPRRPGLPAKNPLV